MDCKTARLILELGAPSSGELDRSESDALERHLADCPECSIAAGIERQVDKSLGQAIQNVAVPADLRERLLAHLDRERSVLYRRWAFRRVREAAAVAAMLLMVSLGYTYWQARHRTVIDTEVIVSEHELRGMRAEDLERWFYQEYSLTTSLPRNIKYVYLYDRALQDLEHRRVASLRFQNGENRAEVFVLTAKEFDLPACLAQPRAGSGGITVEIIPCPYDPNTAYLIRYNSASLDWLIPQGEAPIG
jgi:anti-sigma factor (TIGR02949 family)